MEITQAIKIQDAKLGQIGGMISEIDLTELRSNSPELKEIRDAIYRNKLIVIRNQKFTTSQYVDFTRILGTPQIYFQNNYHHPDYPEVFVSSNVNKEGEKIGVAGTGHYWHTDCQFEKKPLSFTSITPIIIPPTLRETLYIDMCEVYKKLPEDLKTIVDNAVMIHGGNNRYKVTPNDIDKSIQQLIDEMNEMVPFVKHPAVIEHPVTGDKILYMSRGFTMKIEGLSYEENEKIMGKLFDFIEKEEHIHNHSWEMGDLIIWDNRYLLHKSSKLPVGEKSKSYRIGIYDDQPFYVGLEK
ncbi:TauD/TfdA dioxygenase family protein [Aquimarina longa]|uniref:TauD/TfdA dioxygenase family protein n=1 Tax=Aquimarina longa TaxID=1080221 RepID=UPI00078562BD|nr:TauD/TfdA family dioxygenase [Aquimarina longa]